MIIQDLVDTKSSFDANNWTKNITPDEANYEVKKAILYSRVRQYIERYKILAYKRNILYGIIWLKCTPGLQSVLEGNEEYPTKYRLFCSLWFMWEKKTITSGIEVKLNKSARPYHAIQGFINIIQGETDPNGAFKFCLDKIYETMELTDGYNIFCSKKLTKNGSQVSTKDKNRRFEKMKAMCFLLSSN